MNKKQILITSLGNILEWFDFALFIFFAPIIGEQFFPTENAFIATLMSLSVFAAGFICRPIGGILFGYLGDTHGRAKALRLSVLIITLATLLTGLLPSYHTLGVLAPILFVGLRVIQGISIGGEYSGVMIYLAESAPVHRRGFVTSFAATGANVGFLMATLILMLLNTYCSQKIIHEWVWRVPFIFIGIVGLFIVYFRFKLTETPTFSYLKTTQHIERHPLLSALKFAPYSLLKIFGLTAVGSTLYYVFFGYMPSFLESYLNISKKIALSIESVFLVLMLFLVPIAGICGDYFGRKRLLIITSLFVILFAVPSFYLLHSKLYSAIIVAFALASILSSLDQGNSLAAIVENCPSNVRYSGIAFSYNLGNAIFGGTAPLVVALLTKNIGLISPGYYLMALAFLSFISALTLSSKVDLNRFLHKS